MNDVRKFEGQDVLSENPGRCPDCRAYVQTVLVNDAKGGRTWLKCDQLITGLTRHVCENTGSRRAA